MLPFWVLYAGEFPKKMYFAIGHLNIPNSVPLLCTNHIKVITSRNDNLVFYMHDVQIRKSQGNNYCMQNYLWDV